MTKKTPAPDKPPENLADCHNLIRDLFARIAALEKQLSRRNRAAFGKKSAKVNSSLLTGTGKAIYSQTEEELEDEKRNLNIVENKNKGGGRSTSPANSVEHREEKHTVTDSLSLVCPCCGDERTVFGFTYLLKSTL